MFGSVLIVAGVNESPPRGFQLQLQLSRAPVYLMRLDLEDRGVI